VSEPVAEIWNEISTSTGVPLAGLSFIYGAFDFNHKRLTRALNGVDTSHCHCTAAEFCAAFLQFAEYRYGDDHVAALTSWQLNTSEKLGKTVYALVDRKLIGQQDGDRLSDFDDQYDLSNEVRKPSTRVYDFPTTHLRKLVPVPSPRSRSPGMVAIVFVAVWFSVVIVGGWIADFLNLREIPLTVHFIAIALGTLAVSVEYPYRFSLRALLMTITAFALTFGLIAYLVR
jgi:uncharacterized repeat protein (TIGR04138 family)